MRVHRTKIIRFAVAALAGALLAAVLEAATAPDAGATGHPRPLTSSVSARPALTMVVGRATRYLVYNDPSNQTVYLGNPGGKAKPLLFARDARASAVSGDMVEYAIGSGARLWRKLGTFQHGTVPSTWTYLAPDGGLRVRVTGSQTFLDYLHLNGTTESLLLPAGLPTTDAHYSVIATKDGVAVAVAAPHTVAMVAFSTLAAGKHFTLLDTDGIARGAPLTCTGLSTAAVGCLSGPSVIRLATDGTTPPQVSTLSPAPLDVAVTDVYTSWTSPHFGSSRSCPCDMASLDSTGTAESIVIGLTSGAITAGDGRFYYSTGRTRTTAGVHVDIFAGGASARIAPAAPRRLRSSVPALGPGQAAWADDSRAGGALWSATLHPNGSHRARHQDAHGASLERVAVSGLRRVYTASGGVLHIVFGSSDRRLGHGTLVGISGTRVLYRARGGHLILVDLVGATHVDETRLLGARNAALWGSYLSYVRADGSVWRRNVVGSVPAVRLAGAVPHGSASSRIYSWGDWTAWSIVPRGNAATVTAYRNARTHAPARTLAASLVLTGASVGGPLVAHRSGATLSDFMLLAWSSGRHLADVPANTGPAGGVPAIDGTTVAWLRDGIPTAASLGALVANRPRSLGNPLVTTRLKRAQVGRLELPTSARLSHCSVQVHRGSYTKTLSCVSSARAKGEVLVHWPTRSANGHLLPAGHYRWTVRGRNANGSLLTATGKHRATIGLITLT